MVQTVKENTCEIDQNVLSHTLQKMCSLPWHFSSSVSKHLHFRFTFRNNPRLGASNTPFARLLPAEYDDGISQPKGWTNQSINNFLLPLVWSWWQLLKIQFYWVIVIWIENQLLLLWSQVRQVSNNILRTNDAGVVNDREFTHMVTLFGQWNDHDLTFTPFSPSIRSFSNGINCDESCERTEPCIPIPVGVKIQKQTPECCFHYKILFCP